MSDEAKLFSCPFCGGEAEIEHIHDDNGCPEVYYQEWDFYIVACKNCGVSTKYYSNEKVAANHWNSRV